MELNHRGTGCVCIVYRIRSGLVMIYFEDEARPYDPYEFEVFNTDYMEPWKPAMVAFKANNIDLDSIYRLRARNTVRKAVSADESCYIANSILGNIIHGVLSEDEQA